jgi:uncharacterized protein (DUF983 family)
MNSERTTWLTAPCPACGAARQRAAWWKALSRRSALTCSHCGERLESRLSEREYLAICGVGTLLAFFPGVFFVFGLVARAWAFTIIAGLATFGPVFLLGMVMHARHLRHTPTPDRSKAA